MTNIVYTPASNVMVGIEGGWDHRENSSDGWDFEDTHVQASFRYSFSASIGGGQ